VQAEVFLDAAYAIALAALSDQLHMRAVVLAQQLEAGRTHLVTTQAVLLEIGNALSKRRYRAAAVVLLSSLEADPSIEVVSLSPGLYTEAFDLYRDRSDKEWADRLRLVRCHEGASHHGGVDSRRALRASWVRSRAA